MATHSLPFIARRLPHARDVKELDELLVHDAHVGARVAAVLVKDGGERPALQLAQAADDAAGAVVALVAVDQDRMAGLVQQQPHDARHNGRPDLDERLQVALGRQVVEHYALLLDELQQEKKKRKEARKGRERKGDEEKGVGKMD